MPNLVSFYMHQNKLTGTVPRFSNNPRIRTVYLSENNLDGAVPFIESTTLTTLSLHTNKLTSFTKIETPSLVNLYLQNNNFNTQIPDVSNLSRLRTCRLNDNSFNGYKSGIFSSLTNLRSLDLSNNSLTESDINSIMRDMLENYKKSPRGRVTINIRGNSVATGAGVDIIFTLRSYGWIIRN
jgi:Leucine-rich repeat (LRR) protein